MLATDVGNVGYELEMLGGVVFLITEIQKLTWVIYQVLQELDAGHLNGKCLI